MVLKVSNKDKKIRLDNVILKAVDRLLRSKKSKVWSGTMTDLGTKLIKIVGVRKSNILPKSPSSLRVVLNRVVRRFRVRRVGVKFFRQGHLRTRVAKFTKS